MGLRKTIRDWFRATPGGDSARMRRFGIEPMEPRRMMAADVQLGAVYYEDAGGDDVVRDQIVLTFNGGAPGTRLTHVVIETDKESNGLTIGDVFFDTAPGGLGAFGSGGVAVVDKTGIDSVQFEVLDGGTRLAINFTGFDPGDKLAFSVDVDEQGFLGPNAVAEGNEFEGSRLTAKFNAPRHFEALATDIFIDAFDSKFAGSGLDLPGDSYAPPNSEPAPVLTAGGLVRATQQPLPSSIAGRVFDDPNVTSSQDSGELGIAAVALTLWRLDGGSPAIVATAATDTAGNYRFDGLAPGTYRVVETQPGGYLSVGARAGRIGGVTQGVVASSDQIDGVVLLGGDDSVSNDFAEVRPATLAGHVYHDADNDGRLDAGESGIAGVQLTVERLPEFGPTIASPQVTITTAADGSWSAAGLFPGQYRVREIQPAGYLDGRDAAGTHGGTVSGAGDEIAGIVLLGGAAGRNYDFGELRPSSVAGRVHADADGDCRFDEGEQPLSGVRMHLLNAGGQRIATILTDASGRYKFDGLAPGVYGVEQEQPAGYFDSDDHPGSAGGTHNGLDTITSIAMASGTQATDYDFCENLPVSLAGIVYVDDNQNGSRDSDESGIGGVTLRLLDAAGRPTGAVTVTAADGSYKFDGLAPGTYGVAEQQPAGFFDGLDTAGSAGGAAVNPGDTIGGAVLMPGTNATNYNFGEVRGASIRGRVHADRDGDCELDADETPLAGVTIHLLDAGGRRIGSTATDAAGRYAFENLRPGEYGVEEVQPQGYFNGDAMVGSAGGLLSAADRLTAIHLGSGDDAVDYNFCELAPASVAGRVHADLDGDSELDPGESPLAGVTIHLLDSDGRRIASTTTNANGRYVFDNLRPAVYGVQEVQPAGYFDSDDRIGSAGGMLSPGDLIHSIPLGPGTHGIDYNFCELPAATISGYVFQDGPTIFTNLDGSIGELPARDGRRTPDDTPIAGVVIRLGDFSGLAVLDENGKPRTAVTDARGYYEFAGLRPGAYVAFEEQPDAYLDGVDTAGTTGGIAINPGVQVVGLDVGATNDAIARIGVRAGQHSTENNFSEIVVRSRPPFFVNPPPPAIPPLPTGSGAFPQPIASPILPPAILRTTDKQFFGGGGLVIAYTWHLSVIDAGLPRDEVAENDPTIQSASTNRLATFWPRRDLDEAQWLLAIEGEDAPREILFGMAEGIPVTGDFNGDGTADVGVFRDGQWFLDLNGNGVWDDEDLWVQLGDQGDLPVTGDWDGDGKTDIGIYGQAWPGDPKAVRYEPGLPDPQNRIEGPPKNVPPTPGAATQGRRTMKRTAEGRPRSDVIDHVFNYGKAGDIPVTGDFNGDGVRTVGVYRGGEWLVDIDGDGRVSKRDVVASFGRPGDVPVVGDFNGDGIEELGIFRDGQWFLDTNGNRGLDAADQRIELGSIGDVPVVGDWNADGQDDIGVFRGR